MKREALWQGSLDGLCGVYSIVNALSRLYGPSLARDDQEELFVELCNGLPRDGRPLGRIIYEGLTCTELRRLFERANRIVKKKGMAFSYRTMRTKNVRDFIMRIAEELEAERTVVLSIRETDRHWSVVRDVTKKSLLLFDSSSYRRIPIENIRTGEGSARYLLLPSQSFIISRE